MAKGGKTDPFETFTQVRPGEAHLFGHLFSGPTTVHGIHGQEGDPQLTAGQKTAQSSNHQGGCSTFPSQGNSPQKSVVQLHGGQGNQVFDVGLSDPKESERIPVQTKQEDHAQMRELRSEARQYPLRRRVGGESLQIDDGHRAWAFTNNSNEATPGPGHGPGVMGLNEARQLNLQRAVTGQNRQ
jgi:hypothetical protein